MKRENVKKRKENMGLTLGLWTALCTGCMVVMLLFASSKTIVIADAYQEQTGLPVSAAAGEHGQQEDILVLKRTYGVTDSFIVPLPKGVKAEHVVMENRYMDRELWIYIQSDDLSFYGENEISGDVSKIQRGCSEPQEDGILLKFSMQGVMEYKSTLEGSMLTVACYEPGELYDVIVVLDLEEGGSSTGAAGAQLTEKELTLQLAKLVQKKLTATDVRLYLTRTEDTDVSEEERLGLVKAVGADFYIRIGAEYDAESEETYGIRSSYNAEYFFPELDNAELADAVTRAVTIASSNRAVGIFAAAEDSVLKELRTRGVRITVGYLSNPKEEALLTRESYREKLAEGLVSAIEELCDGLQAQEE